VSGHSVTKQCKPRRHVGSGADSRASSFHLFRTRHKPYEPRRRIWRNHYSRIHGRGRGRVRSCRVEARRTGRTTLVMPGSMVKKRPSSPCVSAAWFQCRSGQQNEIRKLMAERKSSARGCGLRNFPGHDRGRQRGMKELVLTLVIASFWCSPSSSCSCKAGALRLIPAAGRPVSLVAPHFLSRCSGSPVNSVAFGLVLPSVSFVDDAIVVCRSSGSHEDGLAPKAAARKRMERFPPGVASLCPLRLSFVSYRFHPGITDAVTSNLP